MDIEYSQGWLLVVGLWLVASLAIATIGVFRLASSFRGSNPSMGPRLSRSPPAALLLLFLGLWSCPLLQLPVRKAANEQFLEDVWSYRGQPLSEVAQAFGPPDRVGPTVRIYNRAPWYAPFGFSTVVLISLDEQRLDHVYYNVD